MKLLITGQSGLAKSLASAYQDHQPTCVSRATGHDIADINQWGERFIDYDMVINCAYRDFAQVSVLDFFFNRWQWDSNKTIVSIGSRAVEHPRIEIDLDQDYWPYRYHKQALHLAWLKTCHSPMKSILINPGPIDTDMIKHLSTKKMDPDDLALRIRRAVEDGWIKRIDLWA